MRDNGGTMRWRRGTRPRTRRDVAVYPYTTPDDDDAGRLHDIVSQLKGGGHDI